MRPAIASVPLHTNSELSYAAARPGLLAAPHAMPFNAIESSRYESASMFRISPFGEQSLTIVAARFDDCGSAERAAHAVRHALRAGDRVDVVGPRDPTLALKLEPEPHGIAGTAIRSHLLLGAAGSVIGAGVAIVALALTRFGAEDVALPLLALAIVLGLFLGTIVAGCVTLRPDHDVVIDQVSDWVRRYKWAVVAHPVGARRVRTALAALQGAGARPIRSL